jgi:hypothetical protein
LQWTAASSKPPYDAAILKQIPYRIVRHHVQYFHSYGFDRQHCQDSASCLGGYLDVGIVVLIAFTGIMIHQRNKRAPRYDISHHIAVYLFPVVLVGMWAFRNSIDFNILLPGLAWRTYFFLSILPHGINLWEIEQHQ